MAGGVHYEHEDEKGCNIKIPFTYISQFSGESSQKSTTFFFPSYSLSMLEHAGFLLQEKKVYKHVGLFASFFCAEYIYEPLAYTLSLKRGGRRRRHVDVRMVWSLKSKQLFLPLSFFLQTKLEAK